MFLNKNLKLFVMHTGPKLHKGMKPNKVHKRNMNKDQNQHKTKSEKLKTCRLFTSIDVNA